MCSLWVQVSPTELRRLKFVAAKAPVVAGTSKLLTKWLSFQRKLCSDLLGTTRSPGLPTGTSEVWFLSGFLGHDVSMGT